MRATSWPVCALCMAGLSGCGSGAPGSAPAPVSKQAAPAHAPMRVTLARPEGGRHDRFAAAITTRRTTGVRGTRSHYTVAAAGVKARPGCVNNRDRRFSDGPAGTRVRAELDPARGEGGPEGWCPGRYRGTVTYFEGFACPAKGTCHVPAGFPTRTQVVARFGFRVR